MNELIAELSKPEYNNMGDQEAANAVNAKTVDVTVRVPNWKIKQHAVLNGYWAAVKAGQGDPDVAKAALCTTIIDWIDDARMETTDFDLPAVQQMIGGLVSFGLITQVQADELGAMASETVSWTSTVGLPEIGIGLVQNARKGIN